MNFSRDVREFLLTAAIGAAGEGYMYHAKYLNPETGDMVPAGIMMFDIQKVVEDLNSLISDIGRAQTWDHPNLIKVHGFFTIKDRLWVVMPPLLGNSMRSVFQVPCYSAGVPHSSIPFILGETLKALHYMHVHKDVAHRSLGADCVFVDADFNVRLAFRSLSHDTYREWEVEAGTFLEWAADRDDEVMETKSSGDIWMFGLLAVELFYGRNVPASNMEELWALIVMGMSDHVRCRGKKVMPKPLAEMVAACLSGDPEKRPTTGELMGYELFREKKKRTSLGKLRKYCKSR